MARNAGRGSADVALFETAHGHPARASGPAPILPVDRRPDRRRARRARQGAARPAAPPGAGRRRRPRARRLVGRRPPGELGRRRRRRPRGGAAARRRGRPSARPACAPWHPGRCAEIAVGGAVLGHAGELHPKVCAAYGVPARTGAPRSTSTCCSSAPSRSCPAPSFSTYPVAKEDVALVVDASVPAAEVEAALREGAGELLESIRLFDVYTGDQVGEGKKSLAFALRFRAPDRTLTEDEAGASRDAAVAAGGRAAGRRAAPSRRLVDQPGGSLVDGSTQVASQVDRVAGARPRARAAGRRIDSRVGALSRSRVGLDATRVGRRPWMPRRDVSSWRLALGVGAREPPELDPHGVAGVGERRRARCASRENVPQSGRPPNITSSTSSTPSAASAASSRVTSPAASSASSRWISASCACRRNDETDGLLLRPGPGRVGGVGVAQRRDQAGRGLVEGAEQVGVARRPLGLGSLLGALRPVRRRTQAH